MVVLNKITLSLNRMNVDVFNGSPLLGSTFGMYIESSLATYCNVVKGILCDV